MMYELNFVSCTVTTNPEIKEECYGLREYYSTKEQALNRLLIALSCYGNPKQCGFIGYENEIIGLSDMIQQLAKED